MLKFLHKFTGKLTPLVFVLLVVIMLLTIVSCGRKGSTSIQASPPLERKAREVTAKKELPKEEVNKEQQAQFPIPEETKAKKLGWIKKDLINVRSQPNTKSDIVTKLKYGTEVQLLELKDKWWWVLLADGQEAFIYQPLLNEGKYIDPWTRFRVSCRLVDSSFYVINTIEKDDNKAIVNLVVSDGWLSITREEQRIISIKAFQYWKECLKASSMPTKNAKITIKNLSGKNLVRIDTGASQRGAQVKFIK